MAEVKEVAAVEYDVRPRVVFRPPVYYPESDGEPMAETDTHRKQMMYLIDALDDYFRDDPNVYVAGNLFIYYQEGDSTRHVAPDVFVVKGVPKHNRRIYQVWEEGQSPDVVFEISSRSTRREDLKSKKKLYEMLGVGEYFIFDPLKEYLDPQLMGFQLVGWGYRRVEQDPLVSRVLGLELRVEGGMLRLVDPVTGERLLTSLEAHKIRRMEAEARCQAEAEVERLRAELSRLRGEATG